MRCVVQFVYGRNKLFKWLCGFSQLQPVTCAPSKVSLCVSITLWSFGGITRRVTGSGHWSQDTTDSWSCTPAAGVRYCHNYDLQVQSADRIIATSQVLVQLVTFLHFISPKTILEINQNIINTIEPSSMYSVNSCN